MLDFKVQHMIAYDIELLNQDIAQGKVVGPNPMGGPGGIPGGMPGKR
jgi:hypothetical protein